jgi:hypothetical protein
MECIYIMAFLDVDSFRRAELLKSEETAKSIAALSSDPETKVDEYLQLFNPDIESYVVTNSIHKKPNTSVFHVRLTRKKIDYREETDGGLKKYLYDVEKHEVRENDQVKDDVFLGGFLNKIDGLAEAIDSKAVLMFEEPRKGAI